MSGIHPFVPIVLLLAAGSCATPGGGGTLIESTEDAATLLARGDRHFDARAYENARSSYELAALAAGGQGDTGRYVEAASQVALVQALTGELAAGREWLASATARVQREDVPAWTRWLIARGVYERADGYTERALATFEEAHALARASAQPVRAVQAAHWGSVTAPDERAVRWCRRALEAAAELESPTLVAALWSQLAWLLEERGLHDDALVAFQRARAHTAVDDEHAVLVADWSLAHGLRLSGRSAEARELLEDVTRRADRRYFALRRSNDSEWVGHCLTEQAELDLLAAEPRRALSRLELARERFREAGAQRLAPERLRSLETRMAQVRARLDSGG